MLIDKFSIVSVSLRGYRIDTRLAFVDHFLVGSIVLTVEDDLVDFIEVLGFILTHLFYLIHDFYLENVKFLTFFLII
jgi:hypothetical protein